MTDLNASHSHLFAHSLDDMRQFAADALAYGKSIGASDTMVEVSDMSGRGVSVRHGALDTIKFSHDKRIGVTVYDGKRRGTASTGDFSIDAIRKTVSAAFDIARFTGEDPFSGLPDAELLETSPRDLGLFHAWDLSTSDAIALATRTEDAAFDADARVSNSSGASVRSGHMQRVLGMSNGFLEGFASSSHSIGCAAIAGVGDDMHKGAWSSQQIDPRRLDTPETVGKLAGERAAAHVGARKLATRNVPVLFESTQAVGLLGSYAGATSGMAQYRRTSFLHGAMGKQVFAYHVRVVDDPFIEGAFGSMPFDGEGVRATRRRVVEGGVVEGYFLSSYSARALGTRTTGNAGGPHNLSLSSTRTSANDDLQGMLRRLGTGLFVTDLMGQGVNLTTGDYSRGATGFWVEGGVIQYPVHEITVASTLQQMFGSIVAIGNDVYTQGGLRSGSMLVESMTIAGR